MATTKKKKTKLKRNPILKTLLLAEKLGLGTGSITLDNKIANIARKLQKKERDLNNPNEMKGLFMDDKRAVKHINALVKADRAKRKEKKSTKLKKDGKYTYVKSPK
jgi:hypothetical protein